jgi:hypothetical protein
MQKSSYYQLLDAIEPLHGKYLPGQLFDIADRHPLRRTLSEHSSRVLPIQTRGDRA